MLEQTSYVGLTADRGRLCSILVLWQVLALITRFQVESRIVGLHPRARSRFADIDAA